MSKFVDFSPGAISGTSRAWKQHSDTLPQAAPSQEQHQIDDTTKHNISSTIIPGGIDNVLPISGLSNDCLKCYQILHDALAKSTDEEATERGYDRDSSLTEIFDVLLRFRAWGGNIAAFRRAKEIRERILRILRDLKQSLETAALIVSGSIPNERWHLGALSDSDDDEVSNTGEAGPETSELEELFTAIKAANGSLLKLSLVIRTSPTRDDYLKAASRYSLDSVWDIGHVREKYGSAKRSTDWLVERMGKAITRRRQYLKYREEHHGKLSRDWEEVPKDPLPDEQRTIALTKATTFVEAKVLIEKADSDGKGSLGSQTSYEPTVVGEDVHKLTPPAPPKFAFEGVPFEFGEPFRCPYCYTEQVVKNKTAWKKHVFRDLKPYVCTFKECDLKMFRSRNEWWLHELHNHRREWICATCDAPFDSKSSFIGHLRSSHNTTLSGSQLDGLVLKSEEPINKIPASACMLCDEWEANLLNPKQDAKRAFLNDGAKVEPCGALAHFRRHLGRHMEQLALFALPMAEGDNMEDDSAGDDDEVVSRQSETSELDLGGDARQQDLEKFEAEFLRRFSPIMTYVEMEVILQTVTPRPDLVQNILDVFKTGSTEKLKGLGDQLLKVYAAVSKPGDAKPNPDTSALGEGGRITHVDVATSDNLTINRLEDDGVGAGDDVAPQLDAGDTVSIPTPASMGPPSTPGNRNQTLQPSTIPVPKGQIGGIEAPPPATTGQSVPAPPPPPAWLIAGLNDLLKTYPSDRFEGVMRYFAINTIAELPVARPPQGQPIPDNIKFMYLPRIRCQDCPGKLYTTGPEMTTANFEVHLMNRHHRERVESRLAASVASDRHPSGDLPQTTPYDPELDDSVLPDGMYKGQGSLSHDTKIGSHLEKKLAQFVVQEDEYKFRCLVPECNRLFKSEYFWKKHADTHHKEWFKGLKMATTVQHKYYSPSMDTEWFGTTEGEKLRSSSPPRGTRIVAERNFTVEDFADSDYEGWGSNDDDTPFTNSAARSPGPITNPVDDNLLDYFLTGRPLDDPVGIVKCNTCRKPCLSTAFTKHSKECQKAKAEKLKNKKEAKENRDREKREENKKAGDRDEEGDTEMDDNDVVREQYEDVDNDSIRASSVKSATLTIRDDLDSGINPGSKNTLDEEAELWLKKMRAEKRRRRRASPQVQRRILSESIGSETDDDDSQPLTWEEANEPGSSARRLRRKPAGERMTLLFDDPPPRIEEEDETGASKRAVDAQTARINDHAQGEHIEPDAEALPEADDNFQRIAAEEREAAAERIAARKAAWEEAHKEENKSTGGQASNRLSI
ncbi:uncharacterized protein PAC_18574 [Phialocephala subalpina]|uniref:C2H2-type domain-containing protein n=1 Tax=Phialocephala subalpina TaxID=576137 RepID=A0A1L7XUI1_9HELO|nr:uncharacterized protein PAC_18574 [Phialocephala subalpina]